MDLQLAIFCLLIPILGFAWAISYMFIYNLRIKFVGFDSFMNRIPLENDRLRNNLSSIILAVIITFSLYFPINSFFQYRNKVFQKLEQDRKSAWQVCQDNKLSTAKPNTTRKVFLLLGRESKGEVQFENENEFFFLDIKDRAQSINEATSILCVDLNSMKESDVDICTYYWGGISTCSKLRKKFYVPLKLIAWPSGELISAKIIESPEPPPCPSQSQVSCKGMGIIKSSETMWLPFNLSDWLSNLH